jgi:hypothetical protein
MVRGGALDDGTRKAPEQHMVNGRSTRMTWARAGGVRSAAAGTRRRSSLEWRRLVLLGSLCLVLGACAGPVRAVRVDRTVAHRDLTRSAVTTGEPSWATRDVLVERGLFAMYDERPEAALEALHAAMVGAGGDPDMLFALAELSALYGEAAGRPEYHLAGVVYAWAFLFPEGGGSRPGHLDPRVRTAADLYNWCLTAAFASQDGKDVVPRGGTFALPFGTITVAFDPAELRVGDRVLHRFTPVAQLEVKGLALRYRWPGVGAPLAASTVPAEDAIPGRDLVAPRLQVPLTALLRIPHARPALAAGQPLTATLELHLAWEADTVSIAGETVPLENEPSAALALTFTGIPIFELETLGLLGRLTGTFAERAPLVATTPYRPGLVPVVFVHGTGSSIVRWAELFNRLQGDAEIRSRYQFWFFQYDSGNPIALSALHLRDAITAAVARIDPEGKDPALRRMVMIGHSQGGLLVKMQSISTGDRLWSAVSQRPLDELRVSDDLRALLRRGLFLEPLPQVARVVFISTPHRGSFVAGRRVIQNLMRRLAVLPSQLAGMASVIAQNPDAMRSPIVPTAVDNMSPRNPFIRGLQQVPVAPGIPAHSIISVDGTGPVEQGDDGVVAYSSAHIEGVESEVVVPSPHSCQGHPQTMEEVRRILRLHVGLPTTGGALDRTAKDAGKAPPQRRGAR